MAYFRPAPLVVLRTAALGHRPPRAACLACHSAPTRESYRTTHPGIGIEAALPDDKSCWDSDIIIGEAWIPDTLRSLRSLTRSGMTTVVGRLRQSPTLAIGWKHR